MCHSVGHVIRCPMQAPAKSPPCATDAQCHARAAWRARCACAIAASALQGISGWLADEILNPVPRMRKYCFEIQIDAYIWRSIAARGKFECYV